MRCDASNIELTVSFIACFFLFLSLSMMTFPPFVRPSAVCLSVYVVPGWFVTLDDIPTPGIFHPSIHSSERLTMFVRTNNNARTWVEIEMIDEYRWEYR
ncbi:hypothetical protein GE21DRAFT_1073390 [Neurospora crassa]|nr:hypothetical protein GE21DRAFT_1073390 [Neurospora crassa]